MNEYKYEDLTYKIVGCAMKVHREIGLGFPEIIYMRCLIIELGKVGLRCESQVAKDIYYDGIKVGSRRLDLLVEEKIIVELKAVTIMESNCVNQILNYLHVFKIEVGLLINFGNKSLEHKRYARTYE